MVAQIDISRGSYVPGAALDDRAFVATVKTAQLLQLVPDPRLTEQPRDREMSHQLSELYELRKLVQRMFVGRKKANVASYADYLLRGLEGADHVVPQIVLWTDMPLEVVSLDHGTGAIEVPYGAPIVAIDGETQLAARHQAAVADQRVLGTSVPVVFHHDRSASWARQAFHDLNTLAVKVNPSLSISMDSRDSATAIANRC